jgi:hypothetical protein
MVTLVLVVVLGGIHLPSGSPSVCSGAVAERSFSPPAGFKWTHDHTIDAIAPPYAQELARRESLDLDRLSHALRARAPLTTEVDQLYISSVRYCGGEWTYVRSDKIAIFELLPVDISGAPQFAVLYTSPYWRLGLVDLHGAVRESFDLSRIAGISPSEWTDSGDMVYTDLLSSGGHLHAIVKYVWTGTGGFRGRGFDFDFVATGSRLCLLRVSDISEGPDRCGHGD